MEIKIKNYNAEQYVPKFQEGGEMAPPVEDPNAAPAPEQGGEDPAQQLLAACQQVLETQDCQLAMQVCQAVIQMLGGGAPAGPEAPADQAPVYKKGGRLVKWIKK